MRLSTILTSLLLLGIGEGLTLQRDFSNTDSDVKYLPDWIFKSFTRACNDDDTFCIVTFRIDTQVEPETPCSYNVSGPQASKKPTNEVSCGSYLMSSSWSNQFGSYHGFTTWAVIDWNKQLIVWPSYSDQELENGIAVTPDKCFAPQNVQVD
jgi:hypothetical protein